MTNAPAQPVQAALEKLRAIAADTGWHPDYRRGLYDAITAVSVALPREAPAAVAEAVTARYTNWRGETAERTFIPHRVFFSSNEWHPEPQVLIEATDCEKGALRIFAASGFASPAPAPEAPAGISTHQVWLDRVADRALQLGRRPTRAEILMCVSDWAALATQADDTKGGA